MEKKSTKEDAKIKKSLNLVTQFLNNRKVSTKIKISYLQSVMFRLVSISLITTEHFLIILWCTDRPVLFLTGIPH